MSAVLHNDGAAAIGFESGKLSIQRRKILRYKKFLLISQIDIFFYLLKVNHND
jgi:hypothetical protein